MVPIAVAAMPLEFGILVNASRTYSLAGPILASAVVLGTATAPVAAQNYAPPPGAVIDLSASGGSIPSGATPYTSAPFTINPADIVGDVIPITFAFRNDYFGLLEFWGVDLFDVNNPGKNLFQNVDFIGAGVGSTSAPSWAHTRPADPSVFSALSLSSGCVAPLAKCWVDATAGGYDELTQKVQSVVLNEHDRYQISFFVSDPGALSSWTWSQYSTNGSSGFGGNGADILVYVGPVGQQIQAPSLPLPCFDCLPSPEPSTWATVLLGLAGLGFLGHRRASALASASRT